MKQGSEHRRALVAMQFHRARRQAAMEALLSRISGQPVDLLSFEEVIGKLGLKGQSSKGVQQIPVDAIVGSVGRYQDFTRTFLPRSQFDENRWVSVGTAARTIADLPPIEVYKIDDSFFVVDGNHRVSLARQQKLNFIDAVVTEVRTRVPLPPGGAPDDLIIAAEYAAFLDYTQLDLSRPGADLRVSVPGQYAHLENHIEAYRFLLEIEQDREVPLEEAAGGWYDQLYLPFVAAIREQGVLRYFPGRTETDFFIWISRHRAELQNEMGLTITPDVAVSRLLSKIEVRARQRGTSIMSRLLRLAHLNEPQQVAPPRTWAQERTLDRYSEHLFATILCPITIGAGSRGIFSPALDQALALGAREEATVYTLCLHGKSLELAETAALDALRERVAREFAAQLLVESGSPTQKALDLAFLNDLIILDRAFNPEPSDEPAPTAAVRKVLEEARRPVWVAGMEGTKTLPERVLLVHDTRRRFDEALFIAAYLAEQWRAELTILPLSNGRNTDEITARVGDYLALHEVDATFLEAIRPNEAAISHIVHAANLGDCDLIVLSGPGQGRNGGRLTQPADLTWNILQRWPRSILIAI